jgi:hypothetical protein
MKFKLKILLALSFYPSNNSFAQKKEETIGSEVVNVVKFTRLPYMDASKFRQQFWMTRGRKRRSNIRFFFPVVSRSHLSGKSCIDKQNKQTYTTYATLDLVVIER